MRALILAAAAALAAQAALAQSFVNPTGAGAYNPAEMRVEWTPEGHETTLSSGYIEQWIKCIVTDGREVIDSRSYPIRWREGTLPTIQTQYCQQMADDYLRYVIDEQVRPREALDSMTGVLTEEIAAAWERFLADLRRLPEPIAPAQVALAWRAAFQPIVWVDEARLAEAMSRGAQCATVAEFWLRLAEYRQWL